MSFIIAPCVIDNSWGENIAGSCSCSGFGVISPLRGTGELELLSGMTLETLGVLFFLKSMFRCINIF